MKYLLKPMMLSLRYKWTLLASIVNALIIGVLWGASITTVYPFMEVIFQGETVDSWMGREIDKSRETIVRLDREHAELVAKAAQATDKREQAGIDVSRNLNRSRQEAELRNLSWYESLRPRLADVVPKTAFGTLALVMGLLVAASVLKGICLVLNVVLVARVADRTVMDMRRIFYRSALHMDQKRIDQLGTTQLMTQISHNVNMVGAGLKRLYGQSIREPLKMLACLVAAGFVCWRLLLLSLVVAPIGALCLHYLTKRMKRVTVQEMGGMASVFETLIETLNGMRIVRIFNQEQRERRRFKHNSEMLYRVSMRMSFYDSLNRPITELLGVLSLVIAILVGAYLVLNQETHLFGLRISDRPLSASSLFVFFGMLAGISDPARKMGDIHNVLVRAAMASRSLYDIFEQKPEIVAQPPRVKCPQHAKSLCFKNTCFAYRPMYRVLHNIDLEIPFGQRVALVGPNGGGKTTLANLVPRFYDPVDGDIFLDGVNLKNISPRDLRRQMALVTQDPVLFRGTIWENIAYGAQDATRDQILTAARRAQVEAFVSQLPQGYETQVGDGGKNLSGGQRQRIALARAIAADPRILILDEATSQIDVQAELDVHQALVEFLDGRTCLFVTHRRSTISLAERVIVIKGGRLIHDLTPEEYLARHAAPEPAASAMPAISPPHFAPGAPMLSQASASAAAA